MSDEHELIITFSPTFGAFAKALVAAKKKMGAVLRNAENPHLKSKYADLASVIDAVEDALLEEGIVPVQAPATRFDGGALETVVETLLLHESGEWMRSRLMLRPTKSDPQGVGSAITYARRYALSAMCNVAPEDDDGNGASGRRNAAAAPADDEPAIDITKAPATKQQLQNLRTMHAKAFEGQQAPSLGAWLVANVAPDIESRPAKNITNGEYADAMDKLQVLLDERKAGEAGRDAAYPPELAPPDDEPVYQSITPLQRTRIMAMFTQRKAALEAMFPDASSAEVRRHNFAVHVLGDPEKGSTKAWTSADYKRVSDNLELLPVGAVD